MNRIKKNLRINRNNLVFRELGMQIWEKLHVIFFKLSYNDSVMYDFTKMITTSHYSKGKVNASYARVNVRVNQRRGNQIFECSLVQPLSTV